jgi:hypothetical protein
MMSQLFQHGGDCKIPYTMLEGSSLISSSVKKVPYAVTPCLNTNMFNYTASALIFVHQIQQFDFFFPSVKCSNRIDKKYMPKYSLGPLGEKKFTYVISTNILRIDVR